MLFYYCYLERELADKTNEIASTEDPHCEK